MDDDQHDDEQGGRPVAALAGLAVIVLLVLAGLWLAHQLRGSASMQDCLASGRTNCAPVETPAQR